MWTYIELTGAAEYQERRSLNTRLATPVRYADDTMGALYPGSFGWGFRGGLRPWGRNGADRRRQLECRPVATSGR